MQVGLSIRGFQKMVGGPSRREMERCLLEMKDFMKELVIAPSPLMAFYADLVPAFLWRWNSREEWSCDTGIFQRHPKTSLIASFKRNINLMGMCTLCPGWGSLCPGWGGWGGWGAILSRRIGQCQDRCP